MNQITRCIFILTFQNIFRAIGGLFVNDFIQPCTNRIILVYLQNNNIKMFDQFFRQKDWHDEV